MKEDLSTPKTIWVFYPEEIFASLTRLSESHIPHRNSCPCNKQVGNPTQLLRGAIASALVLGRHVFPRGGALAGTGISAGDALAELAAETFVLLEEASAPLKMERKKEKRRPPGPVFCLLCDDHTKLARREWHTDSWSSYPWICSAWLTTDCVMHSTYHFTHCYYKATPAFYRNLLTCLPKLKVLNMFLQMD